MPGDTLEIKVDLPDQEVFAENFSSNQCPPPQLASIRSGYLTLTNSTKQPLLTDGKVKEVIKLTPITEISPESPPTAPPNFYQYKNELKYRLQW